MLPACRRARLFKDLDQALVDKLFNIWGGRPRYTLVRALCCIAIPRAKASLFYHIHPSTLWQEKALDPSAQALLEQAMGASDMMTVVRTLGQQGGQPEASDRRVPVMLRTSMYSFAWVCGVTGVEGTKFDLVCLSVLAFAGF